MHLNSKLKTVNLKRKFKSPSVIVIAVCSEIGHRRLELSKFGAQKCKVTILWFCGLGPAQELSSSEFRRTLTTGGCSGASLNGVIELACLLQRLTVRLTESDSTNVVADLVCPASTSDASQQSRPSERPDATPTWHDKPSYCRMWQTSSCNEFHKRQWW